jgi:hypothetical protein
MTYWLGNKKEQGVSGMCATALQLAEMKGGGSKGVGKKLVQCGTESQLKG